jgi:hypothetical protein
MLAQVKFIDALLTTVATHCDETWNMATALAEFLADGPHDAVDVTILRKLMASMEECGSLNNKDHKVFLLKIFFGFALKSRVKKSICIFVIYF